MLGHDAGNVDWGVILGNLTYNSITQSGEMIRWLRAFVCIDLTAMNLGILVGAGSPHPPACGDGQRPHFPLWVDPAAGMHWEGCSRCLLSCERDWCGYPWKAS